MAAKPIAAVGGLVVRQSGLNQHVRLAQHVQPSVASQARTGLLRRLLVQLARAKPELAQVHATRTALLLVLQLLVVGLPMAASL